jgi:poly(3-hydroxybutyrate) depolymerase
MAKMEQHQHRGGVGIGWAVLVVMASMNCSRQGSQPLPTQGSQSLPTQPSSVPLMVQRARHVTRLTKPGPSSQEFEPLADHQDVKVRTYTSGSLQLKGLWKPSTATSEAPLLVYLHGGFALGLDDILACKPFSAAGFAVWAPSWRGENGNAGAHEFAYGELDDAKAAIAFAKGLPGVDPLRIFVFGHSAGAMLSGLLAMSDEPALAWTGGAGGTYSEDSFDAPPFLDTAEERRLRLFSLFPTEIRQRHFVCIGDQDTPVHAGAIRIERAHRNGDRVTVKRVAGNHHTSLPGCMTAYLAHVRLAATDKPH